jgi:hypothetical protein
MSMLNVINLWNTLDTGTKYDEYQLRNTTSKSSGADNEKTWAENIKKNIKTYGENDFVYKFNSLGFRSSEFDNNDPIKILYLGCSVTEGTGLPIEHIWASFLNNQISEEIGKPIKLYNVSRGGNSIDTIVRHAYLTIKNNFKPDFVFFMMPSITRKEVIIDSKSLNRMTTFNFLPNFTPPSDSMAEIRKAHNALLNMVNYRDSYNSAFKNLLFMKHFLMTEQINWAFAFWSGDFNPKTIFNAIESNNNLDINIPKELEDHHIPGALVFDKDCDRYYISPRFFEKPFPYVIARDGLHWGPNSHFNFSKQIYSCLIKKPYFQELLEQWKK